MFGRLKSSKKRPILAKSETSFPVHKLTSMKFKDPVKDGKKKILEDFDALYEELAVAFRNLEEEV